MYLLDTNVWLERLLDQERSAEVGALFERISSEQLYITDFSLHSIGVIMCRLDRLDVLARFVRDAFIDGAVNLTHLGPEDMPRLIRVVEDAHLDFDDAYQYTAAEKYDLTLTSLDKDFDRSARGRKTPTQVLQGL
jgi:uncharacterized protein